MLLLWTLHPLMAQKHLFDQFVGDNKVGELTVEVQETQNGLNLHLNSKLTVSLIFSVDVEYQARATYRDGVLQFSKIKVWKNGNEHKVAVSKKKGRKYQVKIDDEEKILDEPEIDFSSFLLYVREPEGQDRVYSEVDGLFNDLRPQKNGIYHLKLTKNNNLNKYFYENGKFLRAELDHWLTPLTIKAAPEE
ncbi:MAG: DUF6134 family protein [Saprospiraceae bacterium]|nr:DUF6134 family protein [Saprospiraceae bacterium]